MRYRFFVLTATLVAAVTLAPAALAVSVHVRVEGKTQTIFGAAEPRLTATATALDALETASVAGEFYYHVTLASFGPYVDQIGRYIAAGTAGWVYKVNGVLPPVGADQYRLNEGDRVLWYWAQFGTAPGGPETLLLRRTTRNCYRVTAQNDEGVERAATGAVLSVDGRRVRTRAGRGCVGRHRGLVRATWPPAMRSNALK